MTDPVFEVTTVGKGLLYVMPRPDAQRLEVHMRHLAGLDIDLVVSLLRDAEAKHLGLSGEERMLTENGMEFLSFPIPDMNVPDRHGFRAFVRDIHRRLDQGSNVAIHCRAGIGRTGLAACCILIEDGYPVEAARDIVSAARGIRVPETPEQIRFISDYERGDL